MQKENTMSRLSFGDAWLPYHDIRDRKEPRHDKHVSLSFLF